MPSTERTAGYLAQTNASQPSAIETIPTSTARQHLNLATKVRWLAFMLYCVGRTRNKEKMPKNDLDFFFIYTAILYTLTVVDVVVVVLVPCVVTKRQLFGAGPMQIASVSQDH